MRELTKKAATPDEINKTFGVPKGTLANLRSRREGCRFFKVGRSVYYDLQEFEEWLKSTPVLTTDSEKKRN